ncbi:MAG: PASTA domain-containing protein [Oscillospiraceae bacterium]|nr:PASTA domain-containing protein [Oscillospiraceae bacterium]
MILLSVFKPFYPWENALIFALILFAAASLCLAAAAYAKHKLGGRRGNALGILSAVFLLLAAGSSGALKSSLDKPFPPHPYAEKEGVYTDFMVNLVGMDYKTAKAEYSPYFNMSVDKGIYSSEIPAGVIIEQSVREGGRITMGNKFGDADVVWCTVSKGPQMIVMPNTYTVDWETAGQMIEGVGLMYSFTYEYSETVPEGCVISTTPERNEEIEKGSTVNIVVSKGKKETSAETEEE